jgi:hypothetical protein
VTDVDGAPLAGALVCGDGGGPDLSDAEMREPTCVAACADGAYLLANLYPAFWDVNASAPGHRPGRFRERKRETLQLGPGQERTGVDLVLRKGGVEVRGRVKDLGGGVMAGALVTLRQQGSEFEFCAARTTLQPGQQQTLPPIRCPRRRLEGTRDVGGDLGFTLKQTTVTAAVDPVPLVVRPGGPAAGAGLKVGEVFTSIDGQDVTGLNDYLFWTLSQVPEGTTLSLGLARGEKLAITAGPQP